jgi:hypothetical protein
MTHVHGLPRQRLPFLPKATHHGKCGSSGTSRRALCDTNPRRLVRRIFLDMSWQVVESLVALARDAGRRHIKFCLAASISRSTSRSVRYSRLRWPTVTFTEVDAASRSRKFSMKTALPPVHTVTDLLGRVTDLDGCSSPAPPDIAEGSAGKSQKGE